MRARIAILVEVRELDAWRRGTAPLARDHRYLEIAADTLGFDHRVVVVEDDAGEVVTLQPCFFVEQDLIVAAPAWIRRVVAAMRKIFPRFLRLKMLMAGCAAGEGHLDAHAVATPQTILHCHEALLHLAQENGARLVVWKDFPASCRLPLAVLKRAPAGCVHFASMPATCLPLDFASFDDYLARHVSHASRKDLRRKFRALAAAPPLIMSVTHDLGDVVDDALALYEQVRARSPLQFERLTRPFLQQLTARMSDRLRFFLWRQEGRLVAFSLCLVHDGVLYDEYLGLDYRVALDLHLYFVTFRDLVTWALAQGLRTYHSTPLNYEPKLRLGFALAPLDLYVALPWPGLQRFAAPLLRRMGPVRSEPVLAKFANADEMEV